VKRRRWKPEQKALIVLEGLKGRPIGELCAEHEISQAQYYQWRDLFLAHAAASFTAHAVGAGIKPSSLIEDGALKDRIQRLWLAWTDEADADGLTDFYGLQAMAARAMFEAGECFLRFRPRRPDDGLTVPLQLQMLSSEHLPLGKCETLPNGNEIIFGIELDRIGRRVAYHFHRTHPGDVRQGGVGELVRVPAEQVCHMFHPIAEGQIRGVPWVAPAMVRLWLLDQYRDAELDRKKVAAMFAGFVTRPGPDDVMGEDSAQKDAREQELGLSFGQRAVDGQQDTAEVDPEGGEPPMQFQLTGLRSGTHAAAAPSSASAR
jgi:lambda family phage portal protein